MAINRRNFIGGAIAAALRRAIREQDGSAAPASTANPDPPPWPQGW